MRNGAVAKSCIVKDFPEFFSLNVGKNFPIREIFPKKSPSRQKFPQHFTKYEGKFQFSPNFFSIWGKIFKNFPKYGQNKSFCSLKGD
jgi:hypothetical protein